MDTTKDTDSETAPADVTVTFEDLGRTLGLEADLLKGLADMGYTHPTPVQAQAIPAVATGRDLMAQARTGTGKTLAFGLPTLQRIDRASPDTQVLVICPTRELAVQVADEIGRVSKYYQIIVAVVFGGVKVIDQVDEMQWAPIVVGTPGRLRDMIERGYLHLDTCKVVVLDEADEMLDMGFKDDLEFILGKCPKEKQTLLFSATFPPEITRIAHKYMRDPEKIEVSSGYTAATGLQHKFARVPKDKKVQALATLLRQPEMTSSIVFCETKTESAWVFQRLKREGFNIGIITGDVPQEKRLLTLQAFRDGELNVLVATDVAARGLDIPSVSHVFHFTVPRETATYVHRSGRTARAGRKGIAFTLVTPEEDRDFQRIMRDIKQGQPQAPGAAAAPAAREPREGRERGGREGREPREAREGREPREVREPREPRRDERGERALAGAGREEGRDRNGGRDRDRDRTEPRDRNEGRDRGGRDRDRGEGRAPQRHFVPGPVAPEGVGEAITRLGGRHTDEFVSVANSLLMQVDAPRLVAALLSQNPRAVSLLEAAQSGGRAAAGPERADRGDRSERGASSDRERGPRDRNRRQGRDRDRGPRFEREDAPRVRYTAESYGGPELEAARGDRFNRDEERPARPAREERFGREERPAREDRPAREERPAREGRTREVRPAAAAASSEEQRPTRTREVRPARTSASTPAPAAAVESGFSQAWTLEIPEAAPATVHTRGSLGIRRKAAVAEAEVAPVTAAAEAPAKATRTRKAAAPKAAAEAVVETPAEKPKATRARKAAEPKAVEEAPVKATKAAAAPKATATKAKATKAAAEPADEAPAKATKATASKAAAAPKAAATKAKTTKAAAEPAAAEEAKPKRATASRAKKAT